MQDLKHRCQFCKYEWTTVYSDPEGRDFKETCPNCGWFKHETD
jgi:hypothetical protein